MDTRATVEDLLARIGTGDPEEIAAIYAEQVDWQLDWPEEELGGDVPWIRRRATRADVAEHYRALGAHHDASRAHAEVDQILVDGGEAVITGTIVNTVSHTGKRYRSHFALHVTVEHGLVARHHVYEDSLSVHRAWHGH
ncbi:nuclear transport factor 2 family protein [Intrasporangium sp.]|uniref:nuclear transport factor 2 family protein n=1 Tax=Intrasporangium sp. TaxID=1925024 RepID=UPI00293B5BEC|nr:nuclear transport factor 2 family protein [Intrasporangium sp.]MDV3223451.1 nuclear transport factor 2 family protein [Intrasporangium sp.]